jgi:PAS domain S-box-containing protein
MANGGEEGAPSAGVDEVSLGEIPLHSANLLTLLDEDGVVQYESPSIERVFGYDQEALVGEQVADYFHPEDREAVVAAFRAAVEADGESDRVESVEFRHRRADGTYCWVEAVTAARPTPEGYYVVNTRDVSERKAREQELLDRNERLDDFASVLSHDLRNPLQVARSRLALVADECNSDHLAGVDRAHERMEALIDDLLALAQGDKRVEETAPVGLRAVVADCWESVATGDATLVVEADRAVEANRSRLRQLLENLLRNAVVHGGRDVTVTVGTLPGGFYVADDGPGIPAGERETVFEGGHTTAEGGTGFGLRIVEQVATAHGWTVRVTESDAGGARFEVTGVAFAD